MSLHNGKYYLFANWKMYLDYNESNILANALADGAKKFPDNVKMAIFPSALSLYPVAQVLNDVGVGVGPQNVYWVDKGGYTGEISATMYKEVGCEYALVGHSERRHQFYETNHDVRAKMEAVLTVGLTPVLCVGETIAEREANKTEEVIEIQLRAALEKLEFPTDKELIVAYEPVWAISKGIGVNEAGVHCDEVEAERIHKLIAKMVSGLLPEIKPIILFGGSVRKETVAGYLRQSSVHGVLVGAASTHLDSWLEIIKNSESAS
jgi:triosephosphate isomerase